MFLIEIPSCNCLIPLYASRTPSQKEIRDHYNIQIGDFWRSFHLKWYTRNSEIDTGGKLPTLVATNI